MRMPIAKIRIAAGNPGWYDSLTNIHLTITRPEALVYEGQNVTNIKTAIACKLVSLIEGTLDPIKHEEEPIVVEKVVREDKPKVKTKEEKTVQETEVVVKEDAKVVTTTEEVSVKEEPKTETKKRAARKTTATKKKTTEEPVEE